MDLCKENTSMQFTNEIIKIKKNTYISWACIALLFLPIFEFEFPSKNALIISVIAGLIFFIFKSKAIYLLGEISKNTRLFKTYFRYIILTSLLNILIPSLPLQYNKSGTIFGLSILMLYFAYQYTKELYNSTQEKLFFYALFFECMATIFLVCTFYFSRVGKISNLWIFSDIFDFIYMIIVVIAWIKFKKIIIQKDKQS